MSVDFLDLAVEVRLLVLVRLRRNAALLVDLLGTSLGVVRDLAATNDVALDLLLADAVVSDVGETVGSVGGRGAEPKGGTVEEVEPTDGVVLLDDFGVDIRDPEED